MTKETLEWLKWLVSSQNVQIGAPNAVQQINSALRALAELTEALNSLGPQQPAPASPDETE